MRNTQHHATRCNTAGHYATKQSLPRYVRLFFPFGIVRPLDQNQPHQPPPAPNRTSLVNAGQCDTFIRDALPPHPPAWRSALRAVSAPVPTPAAAIPIFADLRATLHKFRRTHGFGRGISAVQIVGGVVPFVIGLCMLFVLPDSIKFMVLRGGRDEAVTRQAHKFDPTVSIAPGTRFVLDRDEGSATTRGSPVGLFRDGWAPVTVLVWLIFVLNLMANNLMNAWLPMIVQTSGHSVAQGSFAGSLYQLGGTVGGLCIGLLIDRFGLKVLAIMFAIGVPVLVFAGTPGISDAVLLTMAFFSGWAIVGMQNGLNAGAGLIYPTALRANGVGYALGIGRIGSVTGPLIGSLLTKLGMSASVFFYVTAFGPLLCFGCCLLLLSRLRHMKQGIAAAAAASPASALDTQGPVATR